jgi:hypothetical protein
MQERYRRTFLRQYNIDDDGTSGAGINYVKLGEDLGTGLLAPAPRGKSWRIFTTGTPEYRIGEDRRRGSSGRLQDRKYYTRYGTPFCCTANAQPEGVVWLIWSHGARPEQRFREFEKGGCESIEEAITPLRNIASILHTLHRLKAAAP